MAPKPLKPLSAPSKILIFQMCLIFNPSNVICALQKCYNVKKKREKGVKNGQKHKSQKIFVKPGWYQVVSRPENHSLTRKTPKD